jgi:hypothetical protein
MMREDKKKIKSWKNKTKKKVKEDIKKAEKNSEGYNEEEQNVIKKNLKTLREGL